jgi:hypothetical protein
MRAYVISLGFLIAACDGQHNVGSIENGSKQACGGIAGKTCPVGEVCVDVPNDGCDPTAGGADCAGSCRKPTGPQCSPDLPKNAICTLQVCGGGYKVVDGEATCECCDVCPQVICALYCPNGFKKDAKGCDICQCNDPPPGVACGPATCPAGQVCCNASCGICTPPGGACIQIACENRTPASGQCIRNSNDGCKSDADCKAGGCGGELCYNPAVSGGVSTCDCTQQTGISCGCVGGKCTWWK